jgi:hypothetical protein
VFGPDCYAPFPFDGAAVHDALCDAGIVPEDLCGPEDSIDQCCLPVVNMSDDRNIPDFFDWMH